MEIERFDVFDFKITLLETEFKQLEFIADFLEVSIEQAFFVLIVDGIDTGIEAITNKE